MLSRKERGSEVSGCTLGMDEMRMYRLRDVIIWQYNSSKIDGRSTSRPWQHIKHARIFDHEETVVFLSMHVRRTTGREVTVVCIHISSMYEYLLPSFLV